MYFMSHLSTFLLEFRNEVLCQYERVINVITPVLKHCLAKDDDVVDFSGDLCIDHFFCDPNCLCVDFKHVPSGTAVGCKGITRHNNIETLGTLIIHGNFSTTVDDDCISVHVQVIPLEQFESQRYDHFFLSFFHFFFN